MKSSLSLSEGVKDDGRSVVQEKKDGDVSVACWVKNLQRISSASLSGENAPPILFVAGFLS